MPANIDQVSRSFAGHIATDPPVRERYLAAQGNYAALAELINQTVDPKVPVQEADAHAIEAFVNHMYIPAQQAEVRSGQSVLDFHGHPLE